MIIGQQLQFSAKLHIDSWQTIIDCLEEVTDFLSQEPVLNAKNIYEISQTKSAIFEELSKQGINFEQHFIEQEEVVEQTSQEVTHG